MRLTSGPMGCVYLTVSLRATSDQELVTWEDLSKVRLWLAGMDRPSQAI